MVAPLRSRGAELDFWLQRRHSVLCESCQAWIYSGYNNNNNNNNDNIIRASITIYFKLTELYPILICVAEQNCPKSN